MSGMSGTNGIRGVSVLADRDTPTLLNVDKDHSCVDIEYSVDRGIITRQASTGSFVSTSWMPLPAEYSPQAIADCASLAYLWNTLELEGQRPHLYRGPERPRVNVVDLFCGCGGLSLGIKRAAEAIGLRPVFLFAADVAEAALKVYVKNLRPLRHVRQNVETLVDYGMRLDGDRSAPDLDSLHLDDTMTSIPGDVDLLVAGPPCEGNSNFNNRTRRFDVRNHLYIDATVAGIALGAKVIVIENVPMVKRSHQEVVTRSLRMLREAGYRSPDNEFVLTASDFGTPQDRRRHFLVAAKLDRSWTLSNFDVLKVRAPTALDVLEDLRGVERLTTFDQPSQLSEENAKRVRFLIEHDEYDLPDDERPDCHRLKDHSYPSIYGRMRPHEPSSTITTGFLSPGRGRFTHPLEARSLTPHEGARLQGFGEDFDWLQRSNTMTRRDYSNMIGAAVPPQLGFAVGMCALSLL